MIRVHASSRLHFGLLSLPAPGQAYWPDRAGRPVVPVRHFGGVGLMIERPALRLTAVPAPTWSAEGPLAGRALEYARRFEASLPAGVLAPQHLSIEEAPPEHHGLGSGTQLALAVARALAGAAGLPAEDAAGLARRVGRAGRSALGLYGFDRGGFLVEAGRRHPDGPAPLAVRQDFPEPWRIVLVLPAAPAGLHGDREHLAFAERDAGAGETDALCRLVLLGLAPAVAERDFVAFAQALGDFNARAGAPFVRAQRGTYAHPRVAEMIAWIQGQGFPGAGQSSWGPAVFAVAADPDRADVLGRTLRQRYGLDAGGVIVTRAANQPALCTSCVRPSK